MAFQLILIMASLIGCAAIPVFWLSRMRRAAFQPIAIRKQANLRPRSRSSGR